MVVWKDIKFYRTEAESINEQNFSNMNVDMSITKIAKAVGDLRIDFRYTVFFEPNVAKLAMYGYVLATGDKKEVENLLEVWQKKQVLPPEISGPLANMMAFSSEVSGVLVARAIGIPVPIIPPNIQIEAKKQVSLKR